MSEHFFHKKSLGQNFLNNRSIPQTMCDAGDVGESDVVLEIGPGTGALTEVLLARGATVIALEADERAVTFLQEQFSDALSNGSLVLHHIDARTYDPTLFGLKDHTFKVVANIPYYLSGLLFRIVLQNNVQPSVLVFLVQKEVAERIVDPIKSKKHSLLSLGVGVYGTPSYIKTVKRGNFTPPPQVDSAIIRVADITRNYFTDFDEATFFTILKHGFSQKRKQLKNNLLPLYSKDALDHAFKTALLPQNIRAEDLRFEDWQALVHTLSTASR
jgi:16S rRNA (adenine1518-N6/adenine1519-N6)-dimethyltransferase